MSFFIQGGLGANIERAFDQARGEIQGGTSTAADFLRSGYESLFNQRAQGLVGGFGEASSRMGAQAAGQGISPDVLSRMLFAPGMELQGQLGSLLGESESGLDFDLAKLFKGTSSEMAGLTEEEMALFVNKEIAKRAAKSGKQAGMISGLGSMAGGALGGYLGGPMGASAGSQLGSGQWNGSWQ